MVYGWDVMGKAKCCDISETLSAFVPEISGFQGFLVLVVRYRLLSEERNFYKLLYGMQCACMAV